MRRTLLTIFLISNSAFAQITRNVPSQYSTIQAAVNAAQSGDTVLVQPGIYYELINVSNKAVYIASKILTTNDTLYISNTIIDGNQLGTVVTLTYTNTTLNGFTIRNGSANWGGGIYIYRASPTLKHLHIIDNLAQIEGGAVFANNESGGYGTISVDRSIIDSNSTMSDNGGGLAFSGATLSLTNSIISRNMSDNYGGGLSLYYAYSTNPLSVSKIDSCQFTANHCAGSGGGIFLFRSNPRITNTTINRNTADYEGGGFAVSNEGGYGTIVIDRSIIDSNSTSTSGGGGLSIRGASLSLTNSVISRNSTSNISGGMLFSNCIQINLAYNTITRNSASSGGAIGYDTPLNGSMVNSILWGDVPDEIYASGGSFGVTNSDIAGGWPGVNNFSADPKFSDSLSYQLSSTSPCISTAKNIDTINYDLRGISRPNPVGTSSDIGALESPYGFSSLPVEISSFKASATHEGTKLEWRTATEVNNAGFDIERQPANTQIWTKLGSVAGAGTSNTPHNYSYTDNIGPAGTYSYRLKQIDRNGAFVYSLAVQVTITVPKVLALSQNYPDPFNPSTTIQFTVPSYGRATLKVYNAIGQEVATLFNDETAAGVVHQVQFNAKNLASGIYFSRLEFGGKMLVKKMLLLR